MKNELREIQEKVRLAAQRKQAEEEQKKIELKKNSERRLIEEKIKLEEELNKKQIDLSLFFIIPLAAFALSFAVYTIFEIYKVNHPSAEPWLSPRISNDELDKAQNELNNILNLISKGKKIENFIKPGIPDTWKKKIIDELCANAPSWQIAHIAPDKFKKGKNPLISCKLKNEKDRFLGLILFKDGDKIYLFKTETMTEQSNDSKK